MKKALEIALSQYGIREVSGKKDNPEVLKYFDEIGFNGSQLKDETAWCSAFANWVCKNADLPNTKKLNARSWLKFGEQTEAPKQGDIVVLWRVDPSSWKGHVGFYIRETKNWIYILGGNQNNRVKISAYPKKRLLEYRTFKH